MRDFHLWKKTLTLLENNIPATLLLVTAIEGSTPAKQGFKMILGGNEEQIGTIGGGHMEYKLLEKCRNMMQQNKVEPIYVVQAHHESAPEEEQSGLICTGTQHIVLYNFKQTDIQYIELILECYNTKTSKIVTLSPNGLMLTDSETQSPNITFQSQSSDDWYYSEVIGIHDTVYIIGAGHVSLALSRILKTLDYYIVLFDHRKDLKLFKDNNFVHEKILGPYDNVVTQIKEGKHSYVVIVLPSFHSDALALGKLINNDYRYIGLLGSSTKLKYVFNEMEKLGISQERMHKIHAPIGLPINNRSPEELAISIAAELIQIKNDTEN